MTRARGESHGRTSLTASQVRSILMYGKERSQSELAAMFGVCQTTIGNIMRGRTWSHIKRELEL